MTNLDFRNLPKQQFPILTRLSIATNGTPLSVTINAINELKDPIEIASFANELVQAHATVLPMEKASNNVGVLISFALGGFNDLEIDTLWGKALPQINVEAGYLPTDGGIIKYHDSDDLRDSLKDYVNRFNRK